MARAGWPGRSASSTTSRVNPDPDQRGVALAHPRSWPKYESIMPSRSAGMRSPMRCEPLLGHAS